MEDIPITGPVNKWRLAASSWRQTNERFTFFHDTWLDMTWGWVIWEKKVFCSLSFKFEMVATCFWRMTEDAEGWLWMVSLRSTWKAPHKLPYIKPKLDGHFVSITPTFHGQRLNVYLCRPRCCHFHPPAWQLSSTVTHTKSATWSIPETASYAAINHIFVFK